MKNELSTYEVKTTVLAKYEPNALADMFDAAMLRSALDKASWSIDEEIALTAEIARGITLDPSEPVKPETKLAAMKRLREISRETLELDGQIATGKATRNSTDQQGRQITEDIATVRLMRPALAQAAKIAETQSYKQTADHDSAQTLE